MAMPSDKDRPWAQAVHVLLPAGLTAFLAFQAGGYFAGATGAATVAMGVIVVVALLVDRSPFGATGIAAVVALVSLLAFGGWQLASSGWSHAATRAIIDADRTLLYALCLAAGALILGRPGARRRAVLGIALGLAVVVVAAFLVRTLPDVFHVAHGPIERRRAAFPLTYWNALGLMAALTVVAGLHVASSREHVVLRLLGAAVVPIAVALLVLTFSRGAIAVAVLGVVVYAVLTHGRRTLAGLLATVPTAAVAAVIAYDSHLDPLRRGAVGDGHRALGVVLACAAGAVLIRLALVFVIDRRRSAGPAGYPAALPRWLQGALAGVLVVAVVVVVASGVASDAYDKFTEAHVSATDTRQRLTQLSGSGRDDAWRVALDTWGDAPVRGSGAGTYATYWSADRPTLQTLFDGHSLYLETMGELGLIGLVLLIVPLALILERLLRRFRRRRDPLYAALFAMAVVWLVHAAIDWDWEMPATAAWLFLAGGAVLARDRPPAGRRRGGWIPRGLLAAGLLALLVLPARAAWSQHKLNEADTAYHEGRCADVARDGLDALAALPTRPEPYQLIGYCDLRVGASDSAAKAFRLAIRRDPRNWQLHYSLAVAQGALAADPHEQVRKTRRLNPRETIVEDLVRAFKRRNKDRWPQLADRLPLPPA
jgi:O-antigen ligase